MPVSVITDVITWIELIAQIGVSTIEVGVLSYLVFFGGWLDMIRLISFWLDVTLIKYIDKFYLYFEKILAGQIFHPDVVDSVMNKVYIFVSLFVLLKVLMLFMKYLVNPELVSDEKMGAQTLIKRVILGMCGILVLPMIFNASISLQKAILNDNLFGKVLLEKADLREYEKNKHQIGRVLAFNVYQAFWNLDKNRVTSSSIRKDYDNAIKAKDPALIGGWFAINKSWDDDYAYDYFPIASCVVLLYVLYLIIKYCIDVVVRMFKLFLLQMIGPLAISDYMINGDSKELFKNWMKTTVSVYAMLFVRIFSIWFIAFITILMNKKCTTVGENGICADSLLYIVGEEPDYLLRGIITLGLLALLIDLPKFLSDIFGLDLEQDATVKGLMQKAGGAAMTGLAIGGAAVGGIVQGAKNIGSSVKGLATSKLENKGKFEEKLKTNPKFANQMSDIARRKEALSTLKGKERKDAKKELKSSQKDLKNQTKGTTERKEYKAANRSANLKAANQIGAGLGGGMRGLLTGVMGNVPGLKNISGGYSQGQGAVNKEQQERAKTSEEFDNKKDAYKKGVDMVVNDLKLNNEKLQFEAEAQVKNAQMDGLKTAIDVDANVRKVNTDNVTSASSVDIEGNIKLNKPTNIPESSSIFDDPNFDSGKIDG